MAITESPAMMAPDACIELLTATSHLSVVRWRAEPRERSADRPPPNPPGPPPGPCRVSTGEPARAPGRPNPPAHRTRPASAPAATASGRAAGKVPFCGIRVPLHDHTAAGQQGHAQPEPPAQPGHRPRPPRTVGRHDHRRRWPPRPARPARRPQPLVGVDRGRRKTSCNCGRGQHDDRDGHEPAVRCRRANATPMPTSAATAGARATRSSCGRCLRRRRTRRRSTRPSPPEDQGPDLAVDACAARRPVRDRRRGRRRPAGPATSPGRPSRC